MSDDPHHINRTFDEELSRLQDMLLRMGSLVSQQLDSALDTFAITHERDARAELMDGIAQREKALNDLERRVQEMAINLAAKRQPMASDLRTIIVAMKVSDAFEAIGDHCASIAEKGSALMHSAYRKHFTEIAKPCACAAQMLEGVVSCCRKWDESLALKVWQKDRDINALHDALLQEFSKFMVKNPNSISSVVDFLSAVKYVERLGDRLKSIVEALYYEADGEIFAPPPLKPPLKAIGKGGGKVAINKVGAKKSGANKSGNRAS